MSKKKSPGDASNRILRSRSNSETDSDSMSSASSHVAYRDKSTSSSDRIRSSPTRRENTFQSPDQFPITSTSRATNVSPLCVTHPHSVKAADMNSA